MRIFTVVSAAVAAGVLLSVWFAAHSPDPAHALPDDAADTASVQREALKQLNVGCVAINEITCRPDYLERFETLFKSRAHAIDKMPGFLGMRVLKDNKVPERYLIVSFWKSQADFVKWSTSPEFREGHKRGFADLADASQKGEKPPMTSTFSTYAVLTD